MDAVIIIGNNIDLTEYDFTDKYVIGVDKGALIAFQNNIKLDIAVGDFDSITPEQLNLIKDWTNVIKLNPIKDETDTYEALNLCNGFDKIIILGGIQGDRIEHFYANLLLIKNDRRIELVDNYSHIFSISENYQIKKDKYKYVSIFSIENTKYLSLQGFKYNLDNYNLNINDPLCISNEVIEEFGSITFKEGRLLVFLSKLDK